MGDSSCFSIEGWVARVSVRSASVQLHEHVSDSGGCLGEHAVMDGEEGEFEAIGDAGLVVDAAEVILDDLLGGAEAHRDFLVFAALNDECDDLHLLGSEAIADSCADAVFFDGEVFRSAGSDGPFAARDSANAIDESGAGDGAMHDAIDSHVEVRLNGFADFGDEEAMATVDVGFLYNLRDRQFERGSKDNGGTAEGFHRREKAVWFRALSDDAEVIFHGENLCGSRAENGLTIGENDLIHLWVQSCCAYTRQKLKQASSRLRSAEMPLGGHCIHLRNEWLFIVVLMYEGKKATPQ